MFTTDKSWERAASLQRSILLRPGQTQYKTVEVPLHAALFYVHSAEVSVEGVAEVRRYCLTTLANTHQFLSMHRSEGTKLFGLIPWQGHLELVEISKIIALCDTHDFQSLFFECGDGTIYLDGIGIVKDVSLEDGDVLWSCTMK